MSESDRQQRRVYYDGRVQGVGFRYTVRSLAARFDVTGFVRNLPDGRVHLVVEGDAGEIDGFLGRSRRKWRHYIGDEFKRRSGPPRGRFPSFEIRH